MRRGRMVGAVGLAGLIAAAAAGQGDATIPGGFRSYIAADDRFPPKVVKEKDKERTEPDDRTRTGKMHCLVVETGLNPACAVFTRTDPAKAAAGPVGTLLRQLDGVVRKNRGTKATAYALFLTLDKPYPEDENRAAKAAAVKALADELKAPGVPFGLAAGAKEAEPGPLAAWRIGDADETVVVVYNRMAEVQRWAFPADKPPTDEDVKAIVDKFEQTAKGG